MPPPQSGMAMNTLRAVGAPAPALVQAPPALPGGKTLMGKKLSMALRLW